MIQISRQLGLIKKYPNIITGSTKEILFLATLILDLPQVHLMSLKKQEEGLF